MRVTAGLAAAAVVAAVLVAAPVQSGASGSPPTVTTGSPTSVTTTSATVGGTVNPNGNATSYIFQYGATTAYGSQTSSVSVGAGTSGVAATASIGGLTADVTYHYRLVATSSAGTADGADATFTTAKAPPVVATRSASSVTSTSAVLNGTVDPAGRATNYQFQYGTSSAYGLETGAASAGSGTSAVAVKATVSGLVPGTTYHFRVIATNPDGTATGSDASFATVSKPPAASTAAPSVVTPSSAVLIGQVNPNGRATTYAFQYGPSTAYGSQTAYVGAGAGTSSVTVSAPIAGLAAGTTYHYRLIATSGAGSAAGADASFTTTTAAPASAATVPVVSQASAVNITTTGAQLNGVINPSASHMTWYFEYGLTSSYGVESAPQSSSGLGARPINVKLAGLEPGATFHYRLVAQSSTTTYVGPDAVFATRSVARLRATGFTLIASSSVRRRGAVVLVTGSLRLPSALTTPAACNGVVEVQVTRGSDTISLRSAPLQPDCTYGEQVSFGRNRLAGAKRLGIAVHFTGNAVLLPTGTRSTRVGA
jgi:phosphodiesterase/alkaline phosphatase D-like protein